MASDEATLHDFPDRSIREELEHPENLRDLLSDALPNLAAGFDYSRVERLPRDFLLEDWRGRESDLLFRIPYRTAEGEQWVLVCVLIEHQSTADPRMPLRMLLYTVLFWEREWKTWEEQAAPKPAFRLTPVVPIVFHTGARPWGNHRVLAELIGGPEEFRKLAPSYQPLFWDLAEHAPEDLLRTAKAWLQVLAVVRVEDAEPATFRRVMSQVEKQLEELSVRDRMRWRELMRFVLAWAYNRCPENEYKDLVADALAAQADATHQQEVRTMSETMADRHRAEGQLVSYREMLRDLLESRFGTLPEDLLRRIDTATDLTRLKTCIRKFEHLKTLGELPL